MGCILYYRGIVGGVVQSLDGIEAKHCTVYTQFKALDYTYYFSLTNLVVRRSDLDVVRLPPFIKL
jgi:hypothetical protein